MAKKTMDALGATTGHYIVPEDTDSSIRTWMNRFFKSDDIIDNVLDTNLDGVSERI